MKKISVLSILSVLVLPAFAEEATVADSVKKEIAEEPVAEAVAEKTESVVEEKADLNADFEQPVFEEKSSNPEIKFPHGLQIGGGISPLSGLNAFIGYNNKKFDSFWWKRFGVRFDLASYSPIKKEFNKELNKNIGGDGKDSIKIGDVAIENIDLDANHYGVMVDFYPFGDTWFLGGWRLSGGYFSGKLDLAADLRNTGSGDYSFELNDTSYTYESGVAKAKAKVKWKYSGPYVGTGFDLGLFWGFKIYLDAGVVLSDKSAKAELNVPITDDLTVGGAHVKGDAAKEAKFKADKKAELSKVQDKMDDYPYYPVVKLGIMYRF